MTVITTKCYFYYGKTDEDKKTRIGKMGEVERIRRRTNFNKNP